MWLLVLRFKSKLGINMKSLTFILVAVFTFWVQIAEADELEDFGEQSSHFYLAPSQTAFDEFQRKAERVRPQLEAAGNGSQLLVAVMIAKISQSNGWPIAGGSVGAAAKEIVEGRSDLAKYIADDTRVDPTKLDVWWASFFATGDIRYLEKLFRYAGRALPKGDIGSMMVIGAATWSFKANCRQHRRVLDFAKRKLALTTVSGEQNTFLKECIAYAEAIDAEPHAPGGAPQAARP
jgi:hypothetical protein